MPSYKNIKRKLFAISNLCYYCGKELTLETATVEHLQPVWIGGKTDLENCKLACSKCNNLKNREFRSQFSSEYVCKTAKKNRIKRILESGGPVINNVIFSIPKYLTKIALNNKIEDVENGLINLSPKGKRHKQVIKYLLYKENDYCIICGKELKQHAYMCILRNDGVLNLICSDCRSVRGKYKNYNFIDFINAQLPEEYKKDKILV